MLVLGMGVARSPSVIRGQDAFDFWHVFQRHVHDPEEVGLLEYLPSSLTDGALDTEAVRLGLSLVAPRGLIDRAWWSSRLFADHAQPLWGVTLAGVLLAAGLCRQPDVVDGVVRGLRVGLDLDAAQSAREEAPVTNRLLDLSPLQSVLDFWYHYQALVYDPLSVQRIFNLRETLFRPLDEDARRRADTRLLEMPPLRALYARRNDELLSRRYDLSALGLLPKGTLGEVFATTLRAKGLDPDFYPPQSAEGVFAFLNYRMRKTHDIHHVLTGFDTDVPGEIGITAFYLSQNRTPSTLMLISAYLLGAALRADSDVLARSRATLAAGLRAGGAAARLLPVCWEEHWEDDIDSVRERYGIQPFDPPTSRLS